jgi:50S ribosomal subunit-associated GTPase HflX
MNKLEKIEHEAQKAREKIAAMQAILKQIDGKRTEQENLQIIQQVRALKLSRDELYGFLNAGELPASLMNAVTAPTEPDGSRLPETVYSRRERTRRHEPDTTTEPEGDGNISNKESEDINNENE